MKGLVIMFLISAMTLTGCNNSINDMNVNKTEYIKISAEEAKFIIDTEDVIILDVRTQEEFNSAHIKNAVLLPVTEIAESAEEVLPDKDAKILVYCRSGNRSATAARELIKMGYTNIYDFGGINTWPYETVK